MEEIDATRIELILDSLEALGLKNYTIQFEDISAFYDLVLKIGLDSQILRDITTQLINQFNNLDEHTDNKVVVNAGTKEDFHKGVQLFAHSQSYPHNFDLSNPRAILTFFEWLIAELQAVLIIAANQENQESEEGVSVPSNSSSSSSSSLAIDIPETPPFSFADQIIFIQKILQLPPQPPAKTLDSAKTKINELIKPFPNYIKSPIFKRNAFTKEQLETLTQINKALQIEYKFRHEVLRKRLGVTLEGFLWSEVGKEKEAEIRAAIQSRVTSIPPSPVHDLYDLFATHTDILEIKKTNSFATELENPSRRSVIVGSVPDRGGRVSVKKGVSEMPSLKPSPSS
eukprot:TRINITY_DN1763_c0_g2_i3.p2 TRINITY_DN1763_c0_g2~~TRINITY_DN1763_c0_g2_i3.p2  ORF type:complete len:342 (+),score=93.49 TRINITY_DN1763_c0_g2_i3:243-1268(+)